MNDTVKLSENQKNIIKNNAQPSNMLWGGGRECSRLASAYWRGIKVLVNAGLVERFTPVKEIKRFGRIDRVEGRPTYRLTPAGEAIRSSLVDTNP